MMIPLTMLTDKTSLYLISKNNNLKVTVAVALEYFRLKIKANEEIDNY